MTSIVFVSDDLEALRVLQRLTLAWRERWKMQFFDEPEHALTFARLHEADVVIADLSAPELGSTDFLALVRDVQPSSARVLLAPFEQESQVLGSTRIVHQVLPKPCDVRALESAIEHIETAGRPSQPDAIRDLVGGLAELPALGEVYTELVAEMAQDSSSSESLGAIVAKDVALTAQILRLVNSSYFGLSTEITSVSHAIGFLGFDVVRAIVIGHSLFDGEPNPIVELAELGGRARLAAALARRSVELDRGRATAAAEAFLAGMLHEVGVLVLSKLPDVDDDTLRTVLRANDLTGERLALGVDRFDVGAHLLGLWGFAPDLVDTVAGLSHAVEEAETPIARAVRLARTVVASEVDVSGELTTEHLEQLLHAAENDEIIDFAWEIDAA